MGFLFKKKGNNQPSLEGAENTILSSDLLEEETPPSGKKEVETTLSLHPSWNISKEDLYVYQFLHQDLPPLQSNQLSLHGISIEGTSDSFKVTAFVRNGLQKAVRLKDAKLALIGRDDQTLAEKIFKLGELGQIPAASSRPWLFEFKTEDMILSDVPDEGWKLAFSLSPSDQKHALDLDEKWEKALTVASKQQLQEKVEKLPPLQPGEVNFLGLQAKFDRNGLLHVTMLIRNGHDKALTLKQLSLQVEDAANDVVAKGGFKLDPLVIKANTSKPWTFIFTKDLLKKDKPDLSKWKATPVR
ncbi:accessory Sec system S-layer assembly protein [Alkalihalobacillus deserti]|uniref:accessory Sec system S-layer assembly protein n=1 Tax=Alkalihalobacillus deserti TaxID=2879466 RepID=UPI0035564F67